MLYNKKILDYWDNPKVESMYDKHLILAEVEMIKKRIAPGLKILDAGCGEAEGTFIYSDIPDTIIHAVDFSKTRLEKAIKRVGKKKNVVFKKVDFLDKYDLDHDYDIIISQRFLINLTEWKIQKRVILDLMKMLKKGGKLIMLEGSVDGVVELNKFKKIYSQKPIPIKWHNLFLKDNQLEDFMKSKGFKLLEKDGLGEYFLLTRGIKPLFTNNLDWKDSFNKISAGEEVKNILGFKDRFSRLKLWVFKK